MSRFRLSPGGRRPHEPWFHIGSLEVSTSWLVVLLSVAAIVVGVVANFDSELELRLAMDPAAVVHQGYAWSVLTWPLSYFNSFGLGTIIAIFLFWYFGSELERDLLGRERFAWLIVAWTVALAAIEIVLYVAFDAENLLAALSLLELMVVLLWIAEWPSRRMFFNIPAWVVGVVIVVLQLFSIVGYRSPQTNWHVALLDFVVGIAVCAFIARQFGLLADYPWLPRLTGHRPRRTRLRSVPTSSAAPSRPAPQQSGPWAPPVSQADEDRMNQLLEKIHDQGADALTDRERAELNELRLRRRQGR